LRDHKPIPLTDETLIIQRLVWNRRGRSEVVRCPGRVTVQAVARPLACRTDLITRED